MATQDCQNDGGPPRAVMLPHPIVLHGIIRTQALPRYARAGIGEVWLVDAGRQMIEQYTKPVANEYTLLHKVMPGYRITAVMLPQVSFTTDALFS